MSPVTLKLDHPDFPDDYEFGIAELGRVKNHGTLEVSDEDAEAFEATKGMNLADAFANNALVTVSGQEATKKQEEEVTEIGEAPVTSAPVAASVVPPADEAGEQ